MRAYAVVVEQAEGNLSAYVPDLPRCITVGDSLEEIVHNIQEAIDLYLEDLIEEGQAIPEPTTVAIMASPSELKEVA